MVAVIWETLERREWGGFNQSTLYVRRKLLNKAGNVSSEAALIMFGSL